MKVTIESRNYEMKGEVLNKSLSFVSNILASSSSCVPTKCGECFLISESSCAESVNRGIRPGVQIQ